MKSCQYHHHKAKIIFYFYQGCPLLKKSHFGEILNWYKFNFSVFFYSNTTERVGHFSFYWIKIFEEIAYQFCVEYRYFKRLRFPVTSNFLLVSVLHNIECQLFRINQRSLDCTYNLKYSKFITKTEVKCLL